MTTAEPTSTSGTFSRTAGYWMSLRSAPLWVRIATIAAIVLVAYWIYHEFSGRKSSTENDTKSWSNSAMDFLSSQGYSQQTSSDAVTAYASGQQLTPSQVQLIASAIGAVGTPDVQQSSTTTSQLADAPSSGPQILGGGTGNPVSGGTASTTPGAPYPGSAQPTTNAGTTATSYWYVPVGVAGWSSTFSGIAEQFYGDSAQAVDLQTANPNLSATTWGKLPIGHLIKVPRPDDTS